MNLLKTSFFTTIATLSTLISGFVVAKFVAIFAGAAAFGLFGQFLSFVSIMQIGAGGVIQIGVIKYVAEYKDDKNTLDNIIKSATSIVTVFSLISSIVVILLSKQLSQIILGESSYYWLFICFSLTLYSYIMGQLIRSIFNGLNKIKEYAIYSIASSIISVIVIPIFAYFYQTNGVLLGFILGQALLFVVVIFFAKRNKVDLFLLHINLKNPWIKRLIAFSIMSIVSAISLPLAQMFVRNYVAENSSWADVGYWQAVLKISDAYLLLVTTVISTYALPKYSYIQCNKELKKEVFYLLKIMVPIVFIIAFCLYLFRHLIIIILFSKSFMPMESLFTFQLLGDVVKIASWIVANTFLAKATIKLFISLEITFTSLFAILSITFFNIYGLHGLTIGFFVNYVIYFIVCLIIFLYKFR